MKLVGSGLVLGLLALLGVGCGGEDGIGLITEPPPEEEPPPPPPPPAPAILGDTIVALDLSNRLLVFGAESSGTLSRVVNIRGVAILNRIVGIDFRRSTGDLYGVGSDSRVYIIDVETGDATPVSDERFSPRIISFFDIHFGMAMHPRTDQILLISAESGTRWSIDPDNGTVLESGGVRFDDADIHAGLSPTITGLSYALPTDVPLPLSDGGVPYKSAIIPNCDDELLYAFDADLAWVLGTCDPAGIDFESLLDIDMVLARCSSVAVGPDGNLFGSLLNVANEVNEWASIDPETGEITFGDPVPAPSPVQDFAFIFQIRDLDPPLLDRASPVSASAVSSKRVRRASTDPVLSGQNGLAQCRGGGAPVE